MPALSLEDQDRKYALDWTPPNGKKAGSATSPATPNNRSPSGKSRNSLKAATAGTLEEWFDGGLRKKEKHMSGQMQLPVKYKGATPEQLLLSQEDSDVTVWPVRIDLGNPSKGKGLRPSRTLYHYTDESSWQKAIRIMQSGHDDVPRKLLLLFIEDCDARRRVDLGNPKGELRLSSLEPAYFQSKADLFTELIGNSNPSGKDSRGVAVEDIADYCFAVRMANTNCTKVEGLVGRMAQKVKHDNIFQEFAELSGKSLVKGVTKGLGDSEGDAGEDEGKKGCVRRLCSSMTSKWYDRKKALQRIGADTQKQAGDGKMNHKTKAAVREWEDEMRDQITQKEQKNTLRDKLEEKHDARMQKNVLGVKSKVQDATSLSGQNRKGRCSMSVANVVDDKKKGNPIAGRPQLNADDVKVEFNREMINSATPSQKEIKQRGGWISKEKKRRESRSLDDLLPGAC